MTDTHSGRLVQKRRIRAFCRRGDSYAWLRAHHVQVARLRAAELASWSALILEMAEDGVSGQDGAPLSIKSVSKVWQRVCRDVEAEAGAKAKAGRAVGRKMPSRISRDWRPVVVPPPPIRPQVSQSAPPVALAGRDPKAGEGDVDLPPEAKAEKARALGTLDELDRKTFGIPK
jgi:hypothetical protein